MAILWKRPLSPADLPFSLSLWGWGMPWKPTFRICTSTNSGDWSTPQQLPALCSKWTRSVVVPPLFGQVWILCITFYCQSWEAAHCMLMSLDLLKLYSTCIYWNKELYHLYYYITSSRGGYIIRTFYLGKIQQSIRISGPERLQGVPTPKNIHGSKPRKVELWWSSCVIVSPSVHYVLIHC